MASIAVAAAAAPTGAAAAPTWLRTPGAKATQTFLAGPAAKVAVAPDGSTYVVFADDPIQAAFDASGKRRVRMFRVLPNGRVSASTAVSDASGDAEEPAIAIKPDGSGAVVYVQKRSVDSKRSAYIRRFAAGGKLEAKATLLTQGAPTVASDIDARQPQVAAGPDGTLTVVWDGVGTPAGEIVRMLPDGALKRVANLCVPPVGGSASCTDPQLVSTPSGMSVVTWVQSDNVAPAGVGNQRTVMLTVGRNDVAGTRMNLSVDTYISTLPQIAVGADGASMVAWRAQPDELVCPDPGAQSRIEAVRIDKVGGKSTRKFVTETSSTFASGAAGIRSIPTVASDGKGGFAVGWVESPADPSAASVRFRRFNSAGELGTLGALEVGGDAASLGTVPRPVSFATSFETGAQAVWVAKDSSGLLKLRTVRLARTASPDRTVALGGVKDVARPEPISASGADGTLAVVWLERKPTSQEFRIQVLRPDPKASGVKLIGRVKSGAKKAKLSFKSTKFGSAVVQIAPTSKKTKAPTRVTKIKVITSGSNTLTFDTTGIKRGTYRVTVTLTDLAGLRHAASAKLIVTR